MKGNVLLFSSTGGHVPTILAVSKLLRRSGRYTPIIIFTSYGLYQASENKYKISHCKSMVWMSGRFVDSDAFKIKSKVNIRTRLVNSAKTVVRFILTRMRPISSPFHAALRNVVSAYSYIFTCISVNKPKLSLYVLKSGLEVKEVDRGAVNEILLILFKKKWTKLSKNGFKERLSDFFDGMFNGLPSVRDFIEQTTALMADFNPSLIVFPEENLLYNYHYLVKIAHDRKIPCCIVPFTIANKNEWMEAFHDNPSCWSDKGWNRLFAAAYPDWVVSYRGKKLILPKLHILLSEYLKCVPRIPWLINSGMADVIAVESHFMAEYYIEAGIESDKLQFTGALVDDRLHEILSHRESYRLELSSSLSLVDGFDRVILIALPPNQFPLEKGGDAEFSSYEELLEFMISSVVSKKKPRDVVLVNLHPRTNRNEVCLGKDVLIVNRQIESLIPLSDLFIAVSSATIRLAVSCAVPTINYDAYLYHYGDYSGLSGVAEVDSKAGFCRILDRLLRDERFYRLASAAQRQSASEQGRLDGKSGNRVLGLFDRLVVRGE